VRKRSKLNNNILIGFTIKVIYEQHLREDGAVMYSIIKIKPFFNNFNVFYI